MRFSEFASEDANVGDGSEDHDEIDGALYSRGLKAVQPDDGKIEYSQTLSRLLLGLTADQLRYYQLRHVDGLMPTEISRLCQTTPKKVQAALDMAVRKLAIAVRNEQAPSARR